MSNQSIKMTPTELSAIERMSLKDCRQALVLAEINRSALHPFAQQNLDARVLAIQAHMLRLEQEKTK